MTSLEWGHPDAQRLFNASRACVVERDVVSDGLGVLTDEI
jgi:hypothetical protein